MKISEAIELLKKVQDTQGDVEIGIDCISYNCCSNPLDIPDGLGIGAGLVIQGKLDEREAVISRELTYVIPAYGPYE